MFSKRLTPAHKPIFVARQPIFDAQESIYAYELLFRSSAEQDSAAVSANNDDLATATVIADGFALAFSGIGCSKKAFINFSNNLLLDGSVMAMPKDFCVVEVTGSGAPNQETMEALRWIKSKGYVIALENYSGRKDLIELLALADIIKVNMLTAPEDALPGMVRGIAGSGRTLLASKIENKAAHAKAKALGFKLFQGYHFSRPETFSASTVPVLAPTKMRLLQSLADKDFDIRGLTNVLSQDPVLCYRLLQFINSAAISLSAKIQSVQQALLLMGSQQLRQWLLAVIISDIHGTDIVQEAVYTSLQRARYLESLAHLYNNMLYPPESFFLLGLFSKLDLILGMPMEKLLTRIQLTKGIHEALRGGDSPYLEWLTLARDIERGAWDKVEGFLAAMGLEQNASSRLHAESVEWAQKLLSYNNTSN